jgi:hypothetical protein
VEVANDDEEFFLFDASEDAPEVPPLPFDLELTESERKLQKEEEINKASALHALAMASAEWYVDEPRFFPKDVSEQYAWLRTSRSTSSLNHRDANAGRKRSIRRHSVTK